MSMPEFPAAQQTGAAIPPPRTGADYAVPMPSAPVQEQFARFTGPIGRARPTGLTMLLFFVTLGIWGLVYYYQVFDELKRHTGRGLDGVFALLIRSDARGPPGSRCCCSS